MEVIKIPKERVPFLIGENGRTKKQLEQKGEIKIFIDSEGEVRIEGAEDKTYFAKDVVKAIGRGFKPETAFILFKPDHQLEIINLKDIVNTENAITRIKSRIIGEKGRIKSEIEAATQSNLSIYGHTVGIISKFDSMEYCKIAIDKIIQGSQHSTVLNYLAKAKRELMETRLR